VTTGSDGQKSQPPIAYQLSEIYHPWKFGDSTFYRFWENCWTTKSTFPPYLTTGSKIWENEKKKHLGVWVYLLISESFKKIHQTISEKTEGKKNKQYDYKKVFRCDGRPY
jgi:hypothetical protein